jgi:hypothetical protein
VRKHNRKNMDLAGVWIPPGKNYGWEVTIALKNSTHGVRMLAFVGSNRYSEIASMF